MHLSATDLATAVAKYGRRILPPAAEVPITLDVVPIQAAEPPAWSVDVPLWTAEEGRSDLTLQLTVRAEPQAGYRIEIDDLHVL